jgi:Fe-Mn family superoxide dismutase
MIAKSLTKRAFNLEQTSHKLISLKHLPYEIGALEPVISGKLMEFHYGKHHRTYVNNLNTLMGEAVEAAVKKDLPK